MSTSKTSTTAAAAATEADAKPKIILQPVAIYDTPLSRGVSVGRVAVLLGLLAWGMDGLVADPAPALSRALPVVAAVQAVYAAVCIPPAGSSSSQGSGGKGKKPRPGEKPKKHDGGSNPISSVIVALVLSSLAVPALHALLVLFGAPLLEHAPRTALCAAHIALLARWPVTIVVGAYVGAAAGSLLAGTVLFGRRMAGHAVKAD
ncbi:GPI biosynthesis protein Pig-F [Cordyceps fumosorosea ARSEF 2679]|uniref:GPI biosynthesis protein Pig-F n=1 Tax=Cordyceps fumosorosea (strain ARSEF 2679) TaxID=1081104 RepID=A0A167VUZ0_CORFA|nr:GPI biosynthesis protein Pig-F [Cordyceps fumosorosea ARSEF 2679]OAA63007.1 GPI biosynthesis protein Pig-F [Cordyceps fumosorosea ARSEF 2679]